MPYDEDMRNLAIKVCEDMGVTVHKKGTVVVIPIQGFQQRLKADGSVKWVGKLLT